jgi:hypothetical protein
MEPACSTSHYRHCWSSYYVALTRFTAALQVFTQVTLIALLWGPNSGGLSLMGDVAQVMCDRAFGNPPTLGYFFGLPTTLSSSNSTMAAAAAAVSAGAGSVLESSVAGAASAYASWVPDSLLHSTNLGWLLNGQVLMVLMTIFAVYPLSCQKHMRSLEGAAGAGLLIVAALCALLGFKAWSQGWPAIADGQFPLWSLRVSVVESWVCVGLETVASVCGCVAQGLGWKVC